LSIRPLVYLGAVSYALYMYHLPLLSLLERALHVQAGQLSMIQQLTYWLALLAAVHLSKVLMEDRLARFKGRFPMVVAGTRRSAGQVPVQGALPHGGN
jgi:peptidoglycan/LPS O-acetylase OafA/YrhL